jgi:cysteine desulfurase/selenocysteine lyase
VIYLDHAASSYPKPAAVARAMVDYLETAGSPGRSGHRLARRAEEVIWQAREAVVALFGGGEPERVIFTINATAALNTALHGLLEPGDRVLTSEFEHNSVIRPLHELVRGGVQWTRVPAAPASPLDLSVLAAELAAGNVRLVAMTHASNVTGAVAPLREVRDLARSYGAVLILDASQTVGHHPVRFDDADVVVFSGHKGMLGPQGTGGMYVSDRVAIRPLLRGGTGGRSESPEQPRWLPYALESGTRNGVGVAGLGAAVRHILELGVPAVVEREQSLRARFVDAVAELPGVRTWDRGGAESVGVVSLTIDGLAPTTAASMLEDRHEVLIRAGLHCAPAAHRALGTAPSGTVRFSISHQNTFAEVAQAADAVAQVAASTRRAVAASAEQAR